MVERNGAGGVRKHECVCGGGRASLKMKLKMRQGPGSSMNWKLPFLWRTRKINWRVPSGM